MASVESELHLRDSQIKTVKQESEHSFIKINMLTRKFEDEKSRADALDNSDKLS